MAEKRTHQAHDAGAAMRQFPVVSARTQRLLKVVVVNAVDEWNAEDILSARRRREISVTGKSRCRGFGRRLKCSHARASERRFQAAEELPSASKEPNTRLPREKLRFDSATALAKSAGFRFPEFLRAFLTAAAKSPALRLPEFRREIRPPCSVTFIVTGTVAPGSCSSHLGPSFWMRMRPRGAVSKMARTPVVRISSPHCSYSIFS
mmetsp:Transcript_38996/g.66886  ORF Transcript_38996/g.66886 Transcript_38996/m.66886 type:complete len:206 (-) Transcript_38996:1801-2418(-)